MREIVQRHKGSPQESTNWLTARILEVWHGRPGLPDVSPSIRVAIPEGVGYNVNARTSFDRVTSELSITATGNIGGDSLSGTIGPGGCQLQLADSNGNIEIVKIPLPPGAHSPALTQLPIHRECFPYHP